MAAAFVANSVARVRFTRWIGKPSPQLFRTASLASQPAALAIMDGRESWLDTHRAANHAATHLVTITSLRYPLRHENDPRH